MSEAAERLIRDRELLTRYGCGPIQFSGRDDALYERHLLFDNVVAPEDAGPRERFEAFARSVRDVLSQRWVLTESTYERENPKRVYYLSMEFLIGRSLANNVTNLLLDPLVSGDRRPARTSTGSACSNRNPTPAWATAGSAAWRPAFSTRWRRCSFRRWATACATSTACSGRPSRTAGSAKQPDNWLRRPDPWEVARPHEAVEVKLNCSFEVRGGQLARRCRTAVDLIGIPFDRPVVGYGGKTINTLRLWAAAAPDYLRLSGIQQRRFRRRAGRRRSRPNRSRACSIPTTPPAWGRACASCRSISWSPARWPISCGASAAATPTGARFPRRSPSSSTTRIRRWPSRS